MKLTLMLAALCAVVCCFSGCKKSQPPTAQPMVVEGVNVDMPKLQESLAASGNQDAMTTLRGSVMGLRYRQYDKVMEGLEKLAADTTITEEQKKMANEVIEQMKQVIAKAPAPAQ